MFCSLINGKLKSKAECSNLVVAHIAKYHRRAPIKIDDKGHPFYFEVEPQMRTQCKNIIRILDKNNTGTNPSVPAQTLCPKKFLVIGVQKGCNGGIVLKAQISLANMVIGKKYFPVAPKKVASS